MNALVISCRKDFWQTLAPDFQGKGFILDYADTLEKALDVIRETPPALAILDLETTDGTASTEERLRKMRGSLASILKVNAMIHTAVVSSLPHDELHDATEGYGVLLGLPQHPDTHDVERLCKAFCMLPNAPCSKKYE